MIEMFRVSRRTVIFAGILSLVTVAAASAQDVKKGVLIVEQPWARASAGPAKAGAAYMVIVNKGPAPDRLIAVKSDIAERAEIHTHLMDGAIMRMRQVDATDILPGPPTVFGPGGRHVMFIGLKKPLTMGDKFPLTLVFEKAGSVTVDVDVLSAGASGPGAGRPAKGGLNQGNMHSGHKMPK